MSTGTSQRRSTWLSRKGTKITTLVSWIPLSQGLAIRRFLYSKILGKLGKSVYIEPGVEFLNTSAIEIGNGVKLLRGVRLDSQGKNSKILVGDDVQFAHGVDIKVGRDDCQIKIGDRASFGPYTVIHGPGNITIGKHCLIAAHCGIYATNHQFADRDRKIRDQGLTREGIVIEDDCWLGHGVSVLDGVTIGEGSVIGAGAVVTKTIPPYSVAVGVPARVISQRRSNDPVEELKEALAQTPQA